MTSCRACGNSDLRRQFRVAGWILMRCPSCDYLQISEKPEETAIIATYGESYFNSSKYSNLSTLYKEYKRRNQLILKYLPEGSHLLDYGCGKADFVKYASDRFSFYGIDYSPVAIELARTAMPEMADCLYLTQDLDKMPDDFFDGIMLWDVIEHLWNPAEIMNLLKRKLKTGGYFFISTPDAGSCFARLARKYWPFMTVPEHMGFFSRKTFRKLAEILNLEIMESRSKGKYVNVGFLFYKIKRIFPGLVPASLIRFFQKESTAMLRIYIPTKDILYLVLKKR